VDGANHWNIKITQPVAREFGAGQETQSRSSKFAGYWNLQNQQWHMTGLDLIHRKGIRT
jgi:hypothetical protein